MFSYLDLQGWLGKFFAKLRSSVLAIFIWTLIFLFFLCFIIRTFSRLGYIIISTLSLLTMSLKTNIQVFVIFYLGMAAFFDCKIIFLWNFKFISFVRCVYIEEITNMLERNAEEMDNEILPPFETGLVMLSL